MPKSKRILLFIAITLVLHVSLYFTKIYTIHFFFRSGLLLTFYSWLFLKYKIVQTKFYKENNSPFLILGLQSFLFFIAVGAVLGVSFLFPDTKREYLIPILSYYLIFLVWDVVDFKKNSSNVSV